MKNTTLCPKQVENELERKKPREEKAERGKKGKKNTSIGINPRNRCTKNDITTTPPTTHFAGDSRIFPGRFREQRIRLVGRYTPMAESFPVRGFAFRGYHTAQDNETASGYGAREHSEHCTPRLRWAHCLVGCEIAIWPWVSFYVTPLCNSSGPLDPSTFTLKWYRPQRPWKLLEGRGRSG